MKTTRLGDLEIRLMEHGTLEFSHRHVLPEDIPGHEIDERELWHPVSESPTEYGDYLFWFPNDVDCEFAVCQYSGSIPESHCRVFGEGSPNKATHWRELPAVPQQEE